MTKPSPLSDPGIVADPYPVYARLARREPVHWDEGLNAWAVMKYADCAAALKDPRLKAERMEEVLEVKFPGEPLPPDDIYHRFTKNVMMYTDPPLHDALRRSTQSGFTRAAHEHYGQVIERVAADLVASVPGGTRRSTPSPRSPPNSPCARPCPPSGCRRKTWPSSSRAWRRS